MFASTIARVPDHTDPAVNQQIRNSTWQHINQYAAGGPETIAKRLKKLDREWDIERMLEATSSLLALFGLALSIFITHWFLVIPVVVVSLLLTHAINGWCPPMPFFRRLGFRTQSEIDVEKYALKALRGDFRDIGIGPIEEPSVAKAFQAAES